jgi:hypothetical protein
VIRALPVLRASTRPEALTVTLSMASLDQEIVRLCRIFPPTSRSVAPSCIESPRFRLDAAGVTVIVCAAGGGTEPPLPPSPQPTINSAMKLINQTGFIIVPPQFVEVASPVSGAGVGRSA